MPHLKRKLNHDSALEGEGADDSKCYQLVMIFLYFTFMNSNTEIVSVHSECSCAK